MAEPESVEAPPSATKNLLGGGGCGCGCLGLLTALVGGILIAGVPLAVYEGDVSWVWIAGGSTVALGLVGAALGGVAWAGSLFMD